MTLSNLTRADEERLAKLQKSEYNNYSFVSCDLTYRDLILLLSSDEKVRSMILEICNSYNNNNSVTEIYDYDKNNSQKDFLNPSSNQNYNNNYYDDLQNQISNLQNANDDLQNANTSLQNQIHNLNYTIKNLQSELNSANTSAEDFKNKYENLVEKNQKLLKNVGDSEYKLSQTQDRLEQYSSEIVTLKRELKISQQHNMPTDLIAMIRVLEHLKSQSNLAKLWLGDNYLADGLTINIQRFIARAGNWSNIESFWDAICKLCQTTKQAISLENLQVLKMLIKLYNYSRTDDKTAKLLFSLQESDNNKFNYEIQSRANFCISGENVVEELLPGLKSAFDKVIKQAIVITKD